MATGDSGSDLSSDLGPFAPPARFAHSHVFDAQPPRPRPDQVQDSRYAVSRRKLFWVLTLFAFACVITWPLPFVRELSWYFLPLGYLGWIGLGFAVWALGVWIRNLSLPGLLRYPLEGQAVVGRVVDWAVQIEGSGETQLARFLAEVEFAHPETGALTTATILAPETFWPVSRPRMAPGFVAGDYVSLAYFPGEVEKSLAIYGWLGVDQQCDLFTKDGKPLRPMSLREVLVSTALIISFFWALMGALYVGSIYFPLEPRWEVISVATATCSLLLIFVGVPHLVRNNPSPWPTWLRYVCWTPLFVFGGAMIAMVITSFINGYWDRSPPELQPIQVVNKWEITGNFVMRNYEIEYHHWPSGETKKQGVPVATLSEFNPGDLGAMAVGQGALGMRWARGFYPLAFEDVTHDKAAHPDAIRCRLSALGDKEVRLAPRLFVSTGAFLPVPEAMRAEARKQLLARLKKLASVELLDPQ